MFEPFQLAHMSMTHTVNQTLTGAADFPKKASDATNLQIILPDHENVCVNVYHKAVR